MTYTKLKQMMIETYKSGDKDKLTLLKTLIGEIDRRANGKPTDNVVSESIKYLTKGIIESLNYQKTEQLEKELAILNDMLPKAPTKDEIKAALATNVKEVIRAAKSFGQAMGTAMTTVKKRFPTVDGNTVRTIVEEIRTEELELEKS